MSRDARLCYIGEMCSSNDMLRRCGKGIEQDKENKIKENHNFPTSESAVGSLTHGNTAGAYIWEGVRRGSAQCIRYRIIGIITHQNRVH